MSVLIPVAHDFNCPWCWIGYVQAFDLVREFGVTLEWRGYELYPDELEWPEPAPPVQPAYPDRPATPTRLELAYAAQGMDKPTVERPRRMRTHNAHETAELAKERGVVDELMHRLYPAYWERGENINEPDVLIELAQGLLDPDELAEVMAGRRYADRIVGFNKPAYATGVYNVPTFFIGGERYAEESYRALQRAMRALNP